MFSCEYCGIFKFSCFKEHMRTAASIRCYFDTIHLKSNLAFPKPALLKSLFQNENIKIISKIVNLKKKKILQISCYVYVMFYYEIPCLYQDFKGENLFFKFVLSSHSGNTGPITRDHVKSSKMKNETPLQLYRLFLHSGTGIIFLFFRNQIYQCF